MKYFGHSIDLFWLFRAGIISCIPKVLAQSPAVRCGGSRPPSSASSGARPWRFSASWVTSCPASMMNCTTGCVGPRHIGMAPICFGLGALSSGPRHAPRRPAPFPKAVRALRQIPKYFLMMRTAQLLHSNFATTFQKPSRPMGWLWSCFNLRVVFCPSPLICPMSCTRLLPKTN